MRRRAFGMGALALPVLARGVRAEASGVRIVKQYGLPYLPLMVMEHERLVEKHAAVLGLPSLTVEWPTLGGPGAMIDGLLSGQVDFGVTGAPGLLTLWDKTVGTPRLSTGCNEAKYHTPFALLRLASPWPGWPLNWLWLLSMSL